MTTSAVPIDKKMPTVAYYSDEDTETYTNLLFTELVHEQLVADRGEEEIENDPSLEFLILHTNDSLMKQLGRDLRIISEDFAKSTERRRVLQKAEKVDIEHINYEEFYQFLNELFSTGISRERIVVLLFFCSDIVVRAYNNPLANFKRLFNWFLEYIIDKVCDWVKDHGGWGVVLGHYVPAFSKTIFYITGTVVLTMFLLKKIL